MRVCRKEVTTLLELLKLYLGQLLGSKVWEYSNLLVFYMFKALKHGYQFLYTVCTNDVYGESLLSFQSLELPWLQPVICACMTDPQ